MAIKGGQILHVSGGFVIDRIQTGGVSGINVNEDRLEELGNVEAVGTIRDIPDLTFELESYDTTTELESLLTGGINDEATGTEFNLASFVPVKKQYDFLVRRSFMRRRALCPFLYCCFVFFCYAVGAVAA